MQQTILESDEREKQTVRGELTRQERELNERLQLLQQKINDCINFSFIDVFMIAEREATIE